jgi:AraC-like DNA-binding protein
MRLWVTSGRRRSRAAQAVVPDAQIWQDGAVAGESSYVERAPVPALAPLASSVWVQQVGNRAVAQRHVPHGGAEVWCVLGEPPRLLGPLTTSTYHDIPAGGTVVGIRLRPGVLGGLVGMPADELVDQNVSATDIWSDPARLTDVLGEAATPQAALAALQSFLAQSAGEPDPVVNEAVVHLMPAFGRGTGTLPALLSISERQLRRRCRAAVGVGPKELHRILRFQGFIARVQASVDQQDASDVDLARWAIEAGYHDQAHLSRECRRLAGAPPGELLAQYGAACACGHDHAASYLPMLRRGDGRFVQEGRSVPA